MWGVEHRRLWELSLQGRQRTRGEGDWMLTGFSPLGDVYSSGACGRWSTYSFPRCVFVEAVL